MLILKELQSLVSSLQSENATKDSHLHEALAQIRNIGKDLVESRKAVQNLSKRVVELDALKATYEIQYGIVSEADLAADAGVPSKDGEIIRLRAILAAHGIPSDENSTVISTTDAKVTQLMAQVLNVPVSEITPALLDPMLNAVTSEKVGLLVENKENRVVYEISTPVPMDE